MQMAKRHDNQEQSVGLSGIFLFEGTLQTSGNMVEEHED